ncbi:hypothetical protein [Sandaracinus amylolyticus]|uniref:hypothetical protein n=1 Tax=Sandaracinus amylolyticus TaxID=927083 RepID=UPI001F196BF3|nr:hypothetical protein [Sandaracinus amylolyticus]UJR82759.1 Hypothetical protein I5071_48240 [Sandaracinus amylolyticus]
MMRLRVLAAALVVLALMIAGVVLDAARRRGDGAHARAMRVELARTIGLPDLALSSGARWLRHPSQVEPAAALSDAPGALDVDPAGAWIAPPRAVLGAGATGRIERR